MLQSTFIHHTDGILPARIHGSFSIREILLLVVLCVPLFLRLGNMEIQPWDEALYAVRAKACLQHGAWLDQTDLAVGGLYSSSHPPLGVWAIACSYAAFGVNEWSARLPSVLAAVWLLISLYMFLRRRSDPLSAAVGTASLAAAVHFLWYARLGQLEVLQIAFGANAFFSFVSYLEDERNKDAVLSGAYLGCAIMTKLFLSMLPMVAWIAALVLTENNSVRKGVTISLMIAACISLPWHAVMVFAHGDYLAHILQSITTQTYGGTARPRGSAGIFYISLLLTNLPLLPLACAFHWKGTPMRMAAFYAVLWLGLAMILLTIFAGSKSHFISHLLVPAAILIAAGIPRLRIMRRKRLAALGTLLGLTIAWSASETIRFSVHERILIPEAMPYLPVAVAIAVAGVAGYFWIVRTRMEQARLAYTICLVAVTLLFLSALHNVLVQFPNMSLRGNHAVAAFLEQQHARHLIIIYRGAAEAEMQPQLAYYLDGWTQGFLPGKSFRNMAWEREDTSIVHRLATATSVPDCAILLVRPWGWLVRPSPEDEAEFVNMRQFLASRATSIRYEGMYSMYGRFRP